MRWFFKMIKRAKMSGKVPRAFRNMGSRIVASWNISTIIYEELEES